MNEQEGSQVMATEHAPIEPADAAQPAMSDDQKAEAAKAAAHAAEQAAKDAHKQRFIEYVVPRRAATQYVDEKGKRRRIVTRPSAQHNADAVRANDNSYGGRIGVASAVATITPAQWGQNGVAASQTMVWDKSNNWRIPADQFSDEQINFLLTEDRRYNGVRFELVDGNSQPVDR